MYALVKWNPGKRPWVPSILNQMNSFLSILSESCLAYLFMGITVSFLMEWRMFYQIGELTTWSARLGCIILWPYAVYLWIKMRYFD